MTSKRPHESGGPDRRNLPHESGGPHPPRPPPQGGGPRPPHLPRPTRGPPHEGGAPARRNFLGLTGAALICNVGGHRVALRTPADVEAADASARALPKPKRARDPVDSRRFPTPQPQPGGRQREYWI